MKDSRLESIKAIIEQIESIDNMLASFNFKEEAMKRMICLWLSLYHRGKGTQFLFFRFRVSSKITFPFACCAAFSLAFFSAKYSTNCLIFSGSRFRLR